MYWLCNGVLLMMCTGLLQSTVFESQLCEKKYVYVVYWLCNGLSVNNCTGLLKNSAFEGDCEKKDCFRCVIEMTCTGFVDVLTADY